MQARWNQHSTQGVWPMISPMNSAASVENSASSHAKSNSPHGPEGALLLIGAPHCADGGAAVSSPAGAVIGEQQTHFDLITRGQRTALMGFAAQQESASLCGLLVQQLVVGRG